MAATTEKIVDFLENLQFKKKFFCGVDEQEVFGKFSELDALYQTALIENMKAANDKILTITEQLHQKQDEVEQMTSEIDNLNNRLANSIDDETLADEVRVLESQLNDLRIQYDDAIDAKISIEKDKQQLKEQLHAALMEEKQYACGEDYEELQNKLNELSAENEELKNKINEYENEIQTEENAESITNKMLQLKKQLMADTFMEKEEILAKARKDAEDIISAAELDKEQIRIKSYLDVELIKKEKNRFAEELNGILKEIQEIFSKNDAGEPTKAKTYNITEANFVKEHYEVGQPYEYLENAK